MESRAGNVTDRNSSDEAVALDGVSVAFQVAKRGVYTAVERASL